MIPGLNVFGEGVGEDVGDAVQGAGVHQAVGGHLHLLNFVTAHEHGVAGVFDELRGAEGGFGVGKHLHQQVVLGHGVEVHGLGQNLFKDGALSLGAVEVAVANVADPAVGQGLAAVQQLGAGAGDVGGAGVYLVIDVHQVLVNPVELVLAFDVDGDASHGVDHFHHGGEVDGDVVADGGVKVLVDGLKGQLCPAVGVGGVELVVVVVIVDVDVAVPHQGGDLDGAVLKVGGGDHDGVGAIALHVVPTVDAEDGDVDDPVIFGHLSGAVADIVQRGPAGEVPVEVGKFDVVEGEGRCDEQQDDQKLDNALPQRFFALLLSGQGPVLGGGSPWGWPLLSEELLLIGV